jgi:hypothetical protein
VNCIGIFIAKLLNDLLDPVKLLSSSKVSNHPLKTADRLYVSVVQKSGGRCVLESSDLPLIIQLVVQGALDTLIHLGRLSVSQAHGMDIG